MAVLISAKNDAQFSSSFFHLKNSSFLSLSNSDAMLAAVFCVTPAPAGKVEKMRAYLRLVSQISAVVDELRFLLAAPNLLAVFLAVPLFSRGHLFTASEVLWAHVLHVRSSI